MSTNKPNILIIGASGHAKVIIDIVERLNKHCIVGLIDSFKPIGTQLMGYPIIGHEKDLPQLQKKYNVNTGIIAIGDNWIRKVMYKKIMAIAPGFNFVAAVHPNAVIGKDVKIGKGTIVIAGAIINSAANIGKFCIINTKASLGHDSIMKPFSSLAPDATVGGNVTIGAFASICLSASVIQNITIGKHAIIGAKALVNKNVEDFQLAYGIPAKSVRTIGKGEKYLYQATTYIKQQNDDSRNG